MGTGYSLGRRSYVELTRRFVLSVYQSNDGLASIGVRLRSSRFWFRILFPSFPPRLPLHALHMMRRLCQSSVPPIECSMMWSSSGELGCLLCCQLSHVLQSGQVCCPLSRASCLACLTWFFHSAVPVRDVATVSPPCVAVPCLVLGGLVWWYWVSRAGVVTNQGACV